MGFCRRRRFRDRRHFMCSGSIGASRRQWPYNADFEERTDAPLLCHKTKSTRQCDDITMKLTGADTNSTHPNTIRTSARIASQQRNTVEVEAIDRVHPPIRNGTCKSATGWLKPIPTGEKNDLPGLSRTYEEMLHRRQSNDPRYELIWKRSFYTVVSEI